jgi:hypothetical protein
LQTFRQVGKDVLLASMGITVSLGIYVASSHFYPAQNAKINPIKTEVPAEPTEIKK